MSRAFTLIEVLVVVAIMALVTAGATGAFVQSVSFDEKVRAGRAEEQADRALRDRLAEILSGAYMTNLPADLSSCFIADYGDGSVSSGGGPATNLTFTTSGGRVPAPVVRSQEDFEQINRNFGPVGGIAEVEISTTPSGSAGDRSGLFLREQRPSDGDFTQGGYESVLDPDVTSISFEFFDGTSWLPTWDSQTMLTRRIPAAVRVTYRRGDEDQDRILVVRLPNSDVTTTNPVEEGA